MSNTAHTFKVGHATVRIEHDEDGSYNCPVFDKLHSKDGPEPMDSGVIFVDLGRRSGMRPKLANDWGPEELSAYAKDNKYWEVPLYKYEHGNVLYKAGFGGNPFSCPWDSGRCGSLLLAKSEWRLSKKASEFADSLCKSVTDWCNGNVFGYVVDLPGEEHADSCWGFIGDYDDKYLIEQATETAQYLSDAYDMQVKAEQENADIDNARKMEAERLDLYGGA
jgi:hypothetical protein